MRVLVTDSNTRPALATTRSLGKAGHVVLTCGDIEPSLAGVSRYSDSHVRCPSPVRHPAEFSACVRHLVVRQHVDVVLPMTEVSTLTLLYDDELWALGTRSPFPDACVVAKAADKGHVLRLAAALGIPTPATIEIASSADLAGRTNGLGYPVVIKPARSRVRTPLGWLSTGVSYAGDPAQLERRLAELPPQVFPILLQERIEGPGVGVFMCFDAGRSVASFAHQRLREMPPSGGVSVLCESCEPDPVAAEQAERLLARLGWRGPAMVEFKRDRRDGSLRLMEINGRFWGSLQLAIDAGVDFPRLAVDIASGTPVAPLGRYRIGIRSRWFWGDASAMLLLLTRDARALDLPPGHAGRWRTLRDFLRLPDSRTRNEVLRRDDWRPFLLESRRWMGGGS
jgi:predicted ATP-grasp superfamily ATP-dependent carboligase